MLLTKTSTFLIGPIATLLGYIMNGVFWLENQVGMENIGLCIILFTIVMYVLMTPLTIKQQKFSKLSNRMNPEIQAIQKKYKGKNQDQAAMMKMNEETKAVYAKYGVSPMGSCLQLAIQMPVLFALYRVVWNIPAYVGRVKDVFLPLAQAIGQQSGAQDIMSELASSLRVSFPEMTDLTIIDVLYKMSPANWSTLLEKMPDLSDMIQNVQKQADHMNYFLGLNIADSPSSIISSAFSAGSYLLLIGAVMVPVLAAVTQWLNTKLMPQPTGQGGNGADENPMANTMKTMNTVMPLMSAVFCFTLPVGLGIYWIAGAVVRSVQQILINKHIDNMDIDEMVKKNLEKVNKKREKQGLPAQKISNAAKAKMEVKEPAALKISEEEKQKNVQASTEYYKNTAAAKPGSLASKAQMVKMYEEKSNKKSRK